MHKAGVKIAMGTDMGFDPEMGANACELEIYVNLGMTPMEAILTTTRNAAHAIKMEKDLGTIEVGKLADIIAVKGDPLKDIRVLQQKKNVLWLPPPAIRSIGGRMIVLVQTEKGAAREEVTVGVQTQDRVEITSGLTEGQVVVGP